MKPLTRKIVSLTSLVILALITSLYVFFIFLARDSFSPLALTVLAILALVAARFFYRAFIAEISPD